MGTIFQKLNYLDGTKGLIRQAINNKGGTLTEDNTFRSYADAIADISTGSVIPYADFTKDVNPFFALSLYGSPSAVYDNYTPNPDGLIFSGYTGSNCRFNMPGVPINKVSYFFNLKVDKFTPQANGYSDIFKLKSGNNTVLCSLVTPSGTHYIQLLCNVSHQSEIIETPVLDLNNKKLNFTVEWNASDTSTSHGEPFITAEKSTYNFYVDGVKKLTCVNPNPIYFNNLQMIPMKIELCNLYENLPDNTSGLQCSVLQCGLEVMK